MRGIFRLRGVRSLHGRTSLNSPLQRMVRTPTAKKSIAVARVSSRERSSVPSSRSSFHPRVATLRAAESLLSAPAYAQMEAARLMCTGSRLGLHKHPSRLSSHLRLARQSIQAIRNGRRSSRSPMSRRKCMRAMHTGVVRTGSRRGNNRGSNSNGSSSSSSSSSSSKRINRSHTSPSLRLHTVACNGSSGSLSLR